jgi:predicted RNase H-related nuclease YkuK (DUF458 family)
MEWQKYNGETIRLPLWSAVEETIIREKNAGNKLKVYIGTDSQVKRGTVEFATVVVFLREHRGGFMFIRKDKKSHNMSIKERMLLEVQHSIEIQRRDNKASIMVCS